MNFLSIQSYLQELSHKQGLKELAIQCGWEYIDNNIKENGLFVINGYARKELRLVFDSHSLIYKNDFGQELLIQTCIRIGIDDANGVWLNGIIPLGKYFLETNEAGQPVDDWLSLDEKPNKEINTVYFIKELNKQLSFKQLQPDAIHYHYTTLVHQAVIFYQSEHFNTCADFTLRAFAYLQSHKFTAEWLEYIRVSKRLLKMLITDLNDKKVLTESLIQQLLEKGILKQKNVG